MDILGAADHVVWFLLETVEALDTSAFHSRRRLGGVGAAGHDTDMLLTLLIYAYARFRAEHQDTFAALFTQVLLVAAEAGLARLGPVAIDGTKIPANASIDANRVEEWLA